MPLLTVTGLGKSFGAEDLFSDINFSIPHRARIALVGPNGIGKTTLLRILLKMDEPSAGSMHFAKNIRIGYLPQEAVFDSDNHLWEECMLVFGDLVARQAELTELEKSISESGNDPEQLEKYGKLQQQFDLIHQLQEHGVEMANGGTGQRSQHARGNIGGAWPHQGA